ncbi:MAG TPA: hypothetical protein VFY45_12000 [Baekduia sp.]|nr:hypothetical protein [Baekduia sp.]
MSTTQRNDAWRLAVDPQVADVLRLQSLIALELNHHHFEDVRDFPPEGQRALSILFRDVLDVLDAVGWEQPINPTATIDVPLTSGYIDLLRERRDDLGLATTDRLPEADEPITAETLASIIAARDAAQVLDRLIATFERRGTEPF